MLKIGEVICEYLCEHIYVNIFIYIYIRKEKHMISIICKSTQAKLYDCKSV